MANTLSTSLWKVTLRPGWEGELGDDCATVCRPDGLGALQLSAYQKNNGAVTHDELLDFASESVPAGTAAHPVQLGAFNGFFYRYVENATFWRRWFLCADQTLLFVTYNCAEGVSGAEDEAVNLTLQSLEAL
jgi:hypothetical protein